VKRAEDINAAMKQIHLDTMIVSNATVQDLEVVSKRRDIMVRMRRVRARAHVMSRRVVIACPADHRTRVSRSCNPKEPLRATR
jgi:hypothetical protein